MASDQATSERHLQSFTLGDWLVDPRACQVSRGDTVVKLRAQLVELLVCLARHAGEIALKDEILAEVWPGQFIAESGLSRCIAELRQILQDDAQTPRYIETITKRGYRVVAPVVWIAPEGSAAEVPVDSGRGEAKAPGAPVADVSRAGRARGPLFRRRRVWSAGAVLLLAVGVVSLVLLKRMPARALLTERDPVVLAFDNRTGDRVFDDTIPLAIAIQLEQSPYLALLPPARVRDALQMMKRPSETPITRAVGLEICERLGARALIVTSISQLGAQYVIGLEAVACANGDSLARQQSTAERKERVLDALQRAAGAIRLAVGESAASLRRYQLPLDEATTVSLEALRAVRLGDVARERGQMDVAAALYREAVALDGDFALAQGRLGRVTDGAERVAALEKAYAMRRRVTLPERLEIEATYHTYATGDAAATMEALELLTQSYPRRSWARRTIATEHMMWGRYDAALPEALEAVRLEPNSAQNLSVLARAHLYLNNDAEARRVAEKAIAAGGVTPDLHLVLYWCAVASNDAALRAEQRAWLAKQPASLLLWEWYEDQAEDLLNSGRLKAAVAVMRQFETLALAAEALEPAAWARLQAARYEALCGLEGPAMRRVEQERRRNPSPRMQMDAVRVAVSAGRFGLAARLMDEIDRAGLDRSTRFVTLTRTYRAAIAASQGRTAEALDLLAPIQPFELGWAYSLEPLLERARVHYLAGDWASARAAYEKILAHWTINTGRKIHPFAQLGLARTLVRAGDVEGGRRTYEQFFERWRGADPGLPLLLDARREYAALR